MTAYAVCDYQISHIVLVIGVYKMKRRIGIQFTVVLVLFALLAMAGIALAAGRPLAADLTGAAEAPGPGDPDGSGSAVITLNQGKGEVCFDITVSGVDPITAAHIHEAPPGQPGPVVVNFDVPNNGLSGCVAASAEEIKEIRQDPGEYYVNVHNAPYPAGALRGQLYIPEE
jgi:hypothetical protein